jgi:SAM-dependent MidA family methyltransferase
MSTDPFQAGLRREPPTDLSDVGEDADLIERIRDEIRREGPITFARFMALALYDPEGGYYRSDQARPGRAGDFLTAPELHPIFGATLATGLLEIWERLGRPDPFVIQEHGAGAGALALAILAAARDEAPAFAATIQYVPVEADERRIDALRESLASAGLGRHLHDDRADAGPRPEPFTGVVIANEVLDALPVHRVRRRGDRLVELGVTVGPDGALTEAEMEPTTASLAGRLAAEGIVLDDGQTAEICLELDAWVAAAAAPLGRGVALLIDYGAPARELYDPRRRPDGTLRAYVRHQVHDDPYRHVGRQDLTAHVDVTAVERAAHAVGLATLGITTQAEALVGLGIGERLVAIQADPGTTFEAYALLRSAMVRLLDPSAMGRFRVMVFARDWPDAPGDAPLGLVAYRLPERGPSRPPPSEPSPDAAAQ